MVFLNHLILTFAAATYALHIPADIRSSSDLNIPDTLGVAQLRAGRAAAWDTPASRMSARQDRELAQRCTADTGKCFTFAAATIAQNWPASAVTAATKLIPEAETCLSDLKNLNIPLHTCLGSCGMAKTPAIQMVECGVNCIVQHLEVPKSCLSFLGDAVLTAVTATSPEAAMIAMLIESIVCELQTCAT